MSIRNIVKVMNFHALIRVDNAKRKADKYRMMQKQLQQMMASILYNRNLILDKKLLQPDPSAPVWNIYLGSDFGFCNNYNSLVNEKISKDHENKKILIGRKLHCRDKENILFSSTFAELEYRFDELKELLGEGIRGRKCSEINIIYNEYVNTTTIYFKTERIYPVETSEEDGYYDDFAMEEDAGNLLADLTASYVNYEVMLAVVSGRAAENVLRQNTTTESLKKIDEIEEEKVRADRREKNNKEFEKIIDNYVKNRAYK